MADVWVILTVVGFFGLCWALVLGCDRIIGPDDKSDLAISDDASHDDATTTALTETAGAPR